MKMTHTQEMLVPQLLGGNFRVTDAPIPNILLRSTRRQMRWTQEEVAKKIGVSTLSIGRWERGETVPSPYANKMLCKLFQRSAEELGLEGEKKIPLEEVIQFANKLNPASGDIGINSDKDNRSDFVPFYKQIRRERHIHGWSQKDIAEMLDCDIKSVSRWERGLTFPDTYHQKKLILLFHKNAEELGLLAKGDSQEVRPSSTTRHTFTLHLPVYCGDCEQPEIVALLDTIQIDPSRNCTMFYLQFTNKTGEDMGLRFESLSLVDQNGDFVLGQSMGSFLLGTGQSRPLTIVFDWIPQPKRVYGFNMVLIRPDKWRNTYKPIPLKF